ISVVATYFLFAFTACLRPNDCSSRPGSMEMGFRCSPSLVLPPFTLRHLTYATSCRTNGLQSKRVGTAISAFVNYKRSCDYLDGKSMSCKNGLQKGMRFFTKVRATCYIIHRS